ncbi:velo1 protein L homeolog [Xenopus laevis]|uniref:Velo1 n=1 Tax=Xenopus laevis TaxID=8355 RepID=Q7T226_XENLA|nr:velo1 protein L homeolog [Xenopus laevis]AAP43960.1 velo1 [Xenopus laevis]
MNTTAPPPENGQYSTNQPRPYFYAQPTAQLPFQNPWYLGQLYNPYCIPGPGFRGGNPYFPYYSVALHEYPGYFVPQPQMNTRMSRRPHFNPHPPSPMFYHATRFRHYSSPGRRTETKETQTDPRQQECASKKQHSSDGKGCDGGNVVYLSSGISSTGNESNLENVEMSMSPATSTQERDFHKNACNSAQYRNMPPGSYAYEKEEVRIEYGSGSPAAIQMWKSYKETIPIYDVAVVKELPENVVQRDLFCEGVLYGPHAEGEELAVQSVAFSNKDECKNSLPPKLCIDAVQETETQTTIVQTREPRYETSKQGKQVMKVKATMEAESPTMVTEHVEVVSPVYDDPQVSVPEDSDEHNLITNGDLIEGSDGCPEQQDIANQSTCNGEVKLANKSNMWTDDSIEKFMPSPTWLACFENIDANYDYDVYSSQRKQKQTSVLSITSEELSSRDEGSSLDSASVSYFVPDYILRKGLYTFRKTTEDLEKETIKSSGSLKEDDIPLKQSCNKYVKKYRSSAVKAKDVSSRCRKIGVPLKGLSRRKLYSVKKNPKKSQSLSEPEDSDEYWVMEEENNEEGDDEDDSEEEEYYFQESLPHGQVDIGKGSIFKQIAQKRILWKPPKGMVPAQIVGWPVKEKLVTKKGAYDALNQVCRLKDYDGSDYTIYDKKISKLNRGFISEPKKSMQKSVGGKAQKKTPGTAVEEYWVGRGAKPKFPEPAYYLQDPTKIKEQDKPPKKKGALKSSKRKQTRTDPEEVETWEVPRSFLYRGHGLQKRGTKKKQLNGKL